MLWQRVVTALIMLPLALFAIFFLPLEVFNKVVAIIILIGFWEWSGFIGKIAFISRLAYVLLSAGLMWLVYNNSLPIDYWNGWIIPQNISELFQKDAAFISLVLSALWWVFAFILVIIYPKVSENFNSNFFIMALIGWLLLIPTWVALTGLRSIGMALDFSRGSGLLLFALCLVWAADTGAFFSGKMFGKHKLAPHVSPKKTWEGVIGGVVFASLITFLAVKSLSIPEDKFFGLAILVIITVSFSVIGDLTESIFKRLSGLKDSGKILPGHGGILDRIDGLTAALPLCLLGFAILGIN